MDIQFPPCGCSSDEDVTPPGLVRRQRRTEGASTSTQPAQLDEMTSHQPGKEHIDEEEDSDEGIEDYVLETDEDRLANHLLICLFDFMLTLLTIGYFAC